MTHQQNSEARARLRENSHAAYRMEAGEAREVALARVRVQAYDLLRRLGMLS